MRARFVLGIILAFTFIPSACAQRATFYAQNVTRTPAFSWARQGTVIGGGLNGNVYEPTILYEANAQILSGTVWKMWYTAGFNPQNLYYAESLDGIAWTQYSGNPLTNLTGYSRSSVVKDGSTYYMSASPLGTASCDLFTSTDGVTWTLAAASIIVPGGAGAWDSYQIQNTFMFLDGSTWRIYYEANSTAAGTIFAIGMATATTPTGTWTKYSGNPVISVPGGTIGGPFVYQHGSDYYLWGHKADVSFVPLYIVTYHSTDAVHWTQIATSITSTGIDEGQGGVLGGDHDPFIIEVGGTTYLYYATGPYNNDVSGRQHIKRAYIPDTIVHVVTNQIGQRLNTTQIDDAFVDADNTAITAHTIAPENVPSATWAQLGSGSWTGLIESNALNLHGISGQSNPYALDSGLWNGTFSTTITIADSDDAAVLFRGSDANNWWSVDLDVAHHAITLYKTQAGSSTSVASVEYDALSNGVAYPLTVYVSNQYVQVYFNGSSVPILEYMGATFNESATKVGLLSGGVSTATNIFSDFEMLYVERMPRMPSFSPAGGTYSSTQSATLVSPGADAIYYTTDGTAPTISSTHYTGAIPVSSSEVINGIACTSGFGCSPLSSVTYTITTAPPPSTGVFAAAAGGTLNLAINVGDTVVVFTNSQTDPNAAPTDNGTSGGNTYSLVTGTSQEPNAFYGAAWICLSATKAATVVTATGTTPSISGGTFQHITAVGNVHYSAPGTGNGPATDTVTTSANAAIVVAGVQVYHGVINTVTSGTQGANANYSAGTSEASATIIYTSVPTLGTATTSTASITSPSMNNQYWQAWSVELK